ncbi:MAG: ketoacyl-ACP synthase III [Tannerella sp.]|jgi:3-oxoacyl-[acyl-carrier-protein] synthase-3|nr:ketoacyl-ACP synthase III [Tannerella sp.]
MNAVITGITGYLPEDVLTNAELEKLVDTSDEWILSRVGISERHVLKKGQGLGTSYMGTKAVEALLVKTGTDPLEVDGLICATTTPDYYFPTAASMIAYNTGCKNALTFDLHCACAGFIYALETAANYLRTGRYKKLIVVAGDTLTSITDYTDRSTCPLFGDGCGAVLMEPSEEELGVIDALLRTDGSGMEHLYMKGGGSAYGATHETVDKHMHYIYQDGQYVFKRAVTYMAEASLEVVKRNHLAPEDIAWIVPHQANMRIIEATARRLGVEDKVLVNIRNVGNTSAGSIPLCLWQNEYRLHKGDNLILTAFGAGFVWGAVYLKWAYDGKPATT